MSDPLVQAEAVDASLAPVEANVPAPASERGAWATAIALGVLGAGVLALALSGVIGGAPGIEAAGPPPVPSVTPTPMLGASTPTDPTASSRSQSRPIGTSHASSSAYPHTIVGDPPASQVRRDLAVYEVHKSTHIPDRWMRGFYPIYATAQRTFGVNWLLIASIHKQESAFSTAPSTYHGLNFAGCCGGPMQFNVTNRPVTTWALVNNSYRYGKRPGSYDHMTSRHPSIYDDYDAIMAGAHLLSADGAGFALDDSAWNAAYDYYGHDLTGVTYANQVLARAIGWSQHGFCINCELDPTLVDAVSGAYGAPVAATLVTATASRKQAKPRRPGR